MPRAHQYFGDLDTYDFDPSFDLFGGGGLVSTTADLARFWRALFAGEVYKQPRTLAEMLTVRRDHAAAGLFQVEVGGYTGWQHGGFWGSEVVHVPDLDLTIALSVGQADGAAAGKATERLLAGLGSVGSASADATPVGPLPAGPVSTITAKRGTLVAIALPRQQPSSGLV